MFSLKVMGINLITIMLCLGTFVSCSKKKDSGSPVAPTPGPADKTDYNKPLTAIPETINVNEFPKGLPLTAEQVYAFIDFQKEQQDLNSKLLVDKVVYPESPSEKKERIMTERRNGSAKLSQALMVIEKDCNLKSKIQEAAIPEKVSERKVDTPYSGVSLYQINGNNCPIQFNFDGQQVLVETKLNMDNSTKQLLGTYQAQNKENYSLQNINKALFPNSRFYSVTETAVSKEIKEYKMSLDPQWVKMEHSYSTIYNKTEINSVLHGIITVETNADSIGLYRDERAEDETKEQLTKYRYVRVIKMNGVTYYHVITHESQKDAQGKVVIPYTRKEYLNGVLISSEQ